MSFTVYSRRRSNMTEPQTWESGANEEGYTSWLTDTGNRVREAAASLADGLGGSMRPEVVQVLSGARVHRRGGYWPELHLAPLVHGTMSGTEIDPRIAAVGALVWAGADLLDDWSDGDLKTEWAPDRLVLAVLGTSAWVPQRAIASFDLEPQMGSRLHDLVGECCLEMAAGQRDDLLLGSTMAEPAAVEASVVGKNGAAQALYAGLGAIAGGASGKEVAHWRDFGRALGAVYQLTSDYQELFHDPEARDLRAGRRTLFVALALEQAGDRRVELTRQLEAAQRDPNAIEAVRAALRRGSVAKAWRAVLQRHVDSARRALDQVDGHAPWAARLRQVVATRSPTC